jgi:hypothetical protein
LCARIWWSDRRLGEETILGDCCTGKLELRAGRSSQSKAVKTQDALEVDERISTFLRSRRVCS